MCNLEERYHRSEKAMEQCSSLPLELVEVIESKLTLYADKVRIRTVCKSWKSHLPVLREHAYLLHSLRKSKNPHGLFNPIDNKIYEIDLQYFGGNAITGSCYSWAGHDAYLINMFTNARIDLPPTGRRHHDMHQLTITKIVLSSPIADENCTAVAIYLLERLMSYCKCGDKTWKYFSSDFDVRDVIYHEGKLLVLSIVGDLSIFEELGQFAKPKFVINIFEGNWWPWAYLVKPSTGGVIVVHVKGNIYSSPPTVSTVELYKVDLINTQRVRIYDIGPDNMFLDDNCAMMVPSAGYKSNQKYIIKGVGNCWILENNQRKSLSVYDVEKGILRFLSDLKITSEVIDSKNIWVKM